MYRFHLFCKRLLDILLSSIGIVIFIPIWIIVAIAIKCDSKGPVFFRQERLTKNGQRFRMYKFRSMVVNAEHKGAGLFNYANDPRVTKIGRILRNTSIDELPQLFNCIKGDLSLVGPRPPVTYELGEYDTLNKRYKKRFLMRGGITGLAQVKGRNENSWDEKVTYDNEYIDMFKEQGVWLDIKIIFWTIAKVFKKQNIYEEKFDESMSDAEAARMAEEEIIRIAHMPDEETCEDE
ncbi:MAG: sugar transferase [Eubacteriaceae bacterium]|jgi:lipopolysaccharide/colanic/teichoic acid biosynthesis glycosyltransferase|nr:sugar transferase [Eubacteriaceae bacterium]